MKMILKTIAILLFAANTIFAQEFMAGADFSHVAWIESTGHRYKDEGKPEDPIGILKKHGINYVRLRQFTSTNEQGKKNPYNFINNLEYNLPLAERVKDAGLCFLLDFHYSDTWADPAHQNKPEAWKNLSFEELKTVLYEYNRDSIAAYKKSGAIPDMVQIGNETTPGMIWPDGKNDSPEQWDKYVALINESIRGIRDGIGNEKMPLIMLHIDRGGDWETSKWFLDNIEKRGVKYDVIGQSYYPFWHGTFDDLRKCLGNCVKEYGKPVVIVETAFPWSEKKYDGSPQEPLLGIQPGKEGQVRFIEELNKVLTELPDKKGLGIFWWGSEFVPIEGVNMASFERRSFFDFEGNALPVIPALGKLVRP